MYPFAHVLQRRALEAFFEVIFDGFHIMANGRPRSLSRAGPARYRTSYPGLKELPFGRRQGTDMGEFWLL